MNKQENKSGVPDTKNGLKFYDAIKEVMEGGKKVALKEWMQNGKVSNWLQKVEVRPGKSILCQCNDGGVNTYGGYGGDLNKEFVLVTEDMLP